MEIKLIAVSVHGVAAAFFSGEKEIRVGAG